MLEALPTYIGKPMASVDWTESRVSISWTDSQESLFTDIQKSEMSLHPELVESILQNLESSQKELEETKQRLRAREAELDVLRTSPVPLRVGGGEFGLIPKANDASSEAVAAALHELYRLGDYFARGQQLVTLLIAQGRETPQVREAMRRVDWPFVCETAPALIRESITQLQLAQSQIRDGGDDLPAVVPTQASLFPAASKRMFP